MRCAWCEKEHTEPTSMLGYKGKVFCCESCLGKYLIEEHDEEITEEWADTEENIRICELEERAEY